MLRNLQLAGSSCRMRNKNTFCKATPDWLRWPQKHNLQKMQLCYVAQSTYSLGQRLIQRLTNKRTRHFRLANTLIKNGCDVRFVQGKSTVSKSAKYAVICGFYTKELPSIDNMLIFFD